MWVVSQADDPFVSFGGKPNKGLSSRSLTSPEVRGKKTSWQMNPERVSWRRETQRGSRERTAKGTSQRELAVQSGQWSAEVGSEEDAQR